MAKTKSTKVAFPDQPPKFKVDDFVEYYFHSGFGTVGRVVEDRGPVGQTGEHYYGIIPVSELAGTEVVYQSERFLRPAKAPTGTN